MCMFLSISKTAAINRICHWLLPSDHCCMSNKFYLLYFILFSKRHQKHTFLNPRQAVCKFDLTGHLHRSPEWVGKSQHNRIIYSWLILSQSDCRAHLRVSFDWVTYRVVLTRAANCFRQFSSIWWTDSSSLLKKKRYVCDPYVTNPDQSFIFRAGVYVDLLCIWIFITLEVLVGKCRSIFFLWDKINKISNMISKQKYLSSC